MKIALPDLVSNSYFPTAAAVDLGCFKDEGLDVEIEVVFPVDRAFRALRDGDVEFVSGSSHAVLSAFPEWQGAKLLCAQAQGMYWFLVMRADLNPVRGDVSIVKGKRIGAAAWVEQGLRRLLIESGIDIENDNVMIAPVPGAAHTPGTIVNFGLLAARALEEGKVDGFWANGMAAEVAVTTGVGKIVLDVRRGDGPPAAFHYTFPAIAATDAFIKRSPDAAVAAVRAIQAAQQKLRQDVSLARIVGEKRFSPRETALIVELVRRDLPFYDVAISPESVASMNAFARACGVLKGDPAYTDVVADVCASVWQVKA